LSEDEEIIRNLMKKKFDEMMKKEEESNRTSQVHANEKHDCDPVMFTDENFRRQVAAGEVIVDFWAEWCGPCRMIEPIISQLAKEYCGKVKFGKLNVDENPVTPTNLNIFSIPTLLFFKQGELRGRIVGAVSKRQIENTMANIV
jgi:thioredoxin 1